MFKQKLFGKVIFALARIFFRKPKAVFETPLPDKPCVVVANHAGAIGPVYMQLYHRRPKKIWIIGYALDQKRSTKFIFNDFFFGRSKKCKKFWWFLSKVVGYFLVPALQYTDGIPVYHDKRVQNTFARSLEELSRGNDIVIFPESPEKYSEFINTFYKGFSDIGRQYYEKTGEKILFFPCYVHNKLHIMKYGNPIEYNPENEDAKSENIRVGVELRNEIDRMARSLPKHKPNPFLPEEWYAFYGEYVTDFKAYWKSYE